MALLLVIDEDTDSRTLTRRILEREGHAVQVFGGAKESMEWLKNNSPELIVVSAGRHGEKARNVLSLLHGAGVGGARIVLCTGVGSLKAVRESLAADVLEVLEKTGDLERLVAVVRSAVASQGKGMQEVV